jgi:nicotinamidase-related amidase
MQSKTALLIIDVQLGMFEENTPVHNATELLTKLAALITRARAEQVPVIYVQHNGPEGDSIAPNTTGWPIHPAIAPAEGELIVHKWHPDSFQDTPLQEELEKRGIKQLVIAGIQTEFCVDTTCRRAYSLGYDVTLVKDAHSTWYTDQLHTAQIIAHHNQVLAG